MTDTPRQPRSSFLRFPNTPWTLIRQAQRAQAREKSKLLGDLVQCYWKPLYAYFRAKGKSRADAEDLVQGLIGKLATQEGFIPKLERTTRFRNWLMGCARNHLIDAERRGGAEFRRPEQPIVSLDQLRSDHGDAFEPHRKESPEHAYRAVWRRQLIARAMVAVRKFSDDQQRGADFQIFLDYYTSEETTKPTWEQLAQRHALVSWKQAARKADWVKEHFGRAIWQEIRAYVDSDADVDDELRDLLG